MRVAPEAQAAAAVVDPRRVARIVSNLLDNAARYAGGAASVEIGCNASHVWFTVADTGPGTPDLSTQERSWSPAGEEKSEASPPATHGLGWALARAHAHLMGGDLTVQQGRGVSPLERCSSGS